MLVAAPQRYVALVLWTLPRALPIAVLAGAAVLLDSHFDFHVRALAVPTSALGTAIALFLGFKNNQAYDRFWEGRKIWGAIVNVSRTFAASVVDFVEAPEDGGLEPGELDRIRRELILRHLAWINALRLNLRRQLEWDTVLAPYLSADELVEVKGYVNVPNRLLRIQSRRVEELVRAGIIRSTTRHLELRTMIRFMWDHQGKCERIKSTPLLPHYTTAATVFVWLFIVLLPFSILSVLGGNNAWIAIPVATLIGWVYDTTNRLGQMTADPFDAKPTDVAMTAICRTIEIDLRPLIGDPSPPAHVPNGLVLD